MSGEITVRTRQRPQPQQTPQPRRAVDLSHSEPAVSVHQGHIHVSRVVYDVETESVNEQVAVPIFHTTPAKVRIAGGITKNLGDYNSARFEVAIEMPCYPEQSEIDRCRTHVSGLVEQYLMDEMQQAGVK